MNAKPKSNLINGKWLDNGPSFTSINPSDTSDCLGTFYEATKEDCNLAIKSASNAFIEWSRSELEERKKILDCIGQELIERSNELGALIAREEGKPLVEGIGEVYRSGQYFQYFGAEVLRQMGEITPSVRPNVNVEVTREPLGVIGVITPWNFPIAVAAWKIAPALAFGNSVVLKPSELVPASAYAFADIVHRSGLPKGVFNCLQGPGNIAGEILTKSKDIDAISFTGSVKTGNSVAQQAIKNMTRIQLEMGSKNALVILNDADIDTAIQCAINGAFFGTGQKCTASSRLIVEQGIHDEFVAKMIIATKALVVGNALDENTQIGPVVDSRQFNQNKEYIESAITEGATMAAGDETINMDNGFYMRPTLFIDTKNDMKINREEVFGPIACVIKVKDYKEALSVSNDSNFGLSSGIVTQSLKHASHFKRYSASGCVMVNLPTAGTDYHVPFGGRKSSSYGPREQGQYAKEFFTVVKTSYISS